MYSFMFLVYIEHKLLRIAGQVGKKGLTGKSDGSRSEMSVSVFRTSAQVVHYMFLSTIFLGGKKKKLGLITTRYYFSY